MPKSIEPALVFFAVMNLTGVVLSLLDSLFFPAWMFAGNALLFFGLISRERKRKQQAHHDASPSA